MRGLLSFFSWEKFTEGKKYIAVGPAKEWLSKDGSVLGTQVKVEIDEDLTPYPREGISNVGEQFNVRIPRPVSEYAWVGRHTPLVVVNVTQCTVFGDFSNSLSVRGDVEKVGK